MGVSTFRIQGYYPFRRASVKNPQECLRRRCAQIPNERSTIEIYVEFSSATWRCRHSFAGTGHGRFRRSNPRGLPGRKRRGGRLCRCGRLLALQDVAAAGWRHLVYVRIQPVSPGLEYSGCHRSGRPEGLEVYRGAGEHRDLAGRYRRRAHDHGPGCTFRQLGWRSRRAPCARGRADMESRGSFEPETDRQLHDRGRHPSQRLFWRALHAPCRQSSGLSPARCT